MTEPPDPMDARLRELSLKTEGLRPSPGFADQVLLRVAAVPSAGGWEKGVVRFGKVVLAVSALAAAVSTFLAVSAERAEDTTLASTYGIEEMDW